MKRKLKLERRLACQALKPAWCTGVLVSTLLTSVGAIAQDNPYPTAPANPAWDQAPGAVYPAQQGAVPPPPGPYAPSASAPVYPAPGSAQSPGFRPDPELEAAQTAAPPAVEQPAAAAPAQSWTPPSPPTYRRQGAITREEFLNQQTARRAEMDKRMQEAEQRRAQAWQTPPGQYPQEHWQGMQAQETQMHKEMQERDAQMRQEMEQRRSAMQKEMQQREEEMSRRAQEMATERQRYAPGYTPGYAPGTPPAQPPMAGVQPPPDASSYGQANAPAPGPQWHPGHGHYPPPGGYGYAPPPGYGPPTWATAPYPPNFPAPAAGTPYPPGRGGY